MLTVGRAHAKTTRPRHISKIFHKISSTISKVLHKISNTISKALDYIS